MRVDFGLSCSFHGMQFCFVHVHGESQFPAGAIKCFEDCFDIFDGCGTKRNVIHKSLNAFFKHAIKLAPR